MDPAPPIAPKRAERLAADIEDRVERERLAPGTHLGTETELMAHYQVSRETLRKAVRQLERHGVAAMRRGGGGGGGGLVVMASAADSVVRAIATHLAFSNIDWAQIVEARALIDAMAAECAARKVDAVGRSRLQRRIEVLERGNASVADIARRQLALPRAVAEASGNPVLWLFISALNHWTLSILPSDLGPAADIERERAQSNAKLRQLVDAVAAGDAVAARQAATAFSTHSRAVGDILERRRRRMNTATLLQDPQGGDKLAQRLALALSREIAERGWVRERFGDEAGLVARLGVSRAVLRESIRLLELHGLLRPQRGRGGGLMMGPPDAGYTIEAARRYLRRANLSPSDYLSVRESLERGAICLAIERADDQALAGLAALGDTVAEADDREVTPRAIAWHARLSILSGNAALSLLLRILYALTEQPTDRVPADIADALRDRHARLTAAVVARDTDRALAVFDEHVAWLRHVLDIGLGSLQPLAAGAH